MVSTSDQHQLSLSTPLRPTCAVFSKMADIVCSTIKYCMKVNHCWAVHVQWAQAITNARLYSPLYSAIGALGGALQAFTYILCLQHVLSPHTSLPEPIACTTRDGVYPAPLQSARLQVSACSALGSIVHDEPANSNGHAIGPLAMHSVHDGACNAFASLTKGYC